MSGRVSTGEDASAVGRVEHGPRALAFFIDEQRLARLLRGLSDFGEATEVDGDAAGRMRLVPRGPGRSLGVDDGR